MFKINKGPEGAAQIPIRVIIFILISFSRLPVLSQSNPVNRFAWADVHLIHNFNEHFRINPGISYRRNIDHKYWQQFFFNPLVIFPVNRTFQIQGSVVLLLTDESENTIFEIRPWQAIGINFPRFRRFPVSHQLRIEERFFFQNVAGGNTNALRGKYTLQAFIPLNRHEIAAGTVYLWPSIELFMDLAGENVEQYINRDRFNLGLGYGFNKFYRLEFCFMQQYARNGKGNGFTESDRIFRLVNRFTVL